MKTMQRNLVTYVIEEAGLDDRSGSLWPCAVEMLGPCLLSSLFRMFFNMRV